MTVNELPEVVYHGTVSVHRESLLSGIDVNKGYKSVDFGQGFYTTSDFEQAVGIAKARTYQYKYNKSRQYPQDVFPMVISYSVDKKILSRNKGLIFDEPNNKWKEFIYNNRVGNTYTVSAYNNLNQKYQYVYGCVADSEIIEMISDVKNGNSNFGIFIDMLKALKGEKYNQLSFHTNSIANETLSVINISIIKEGNFYE